MAVKVKKFNNQEYEVLEHDETPGFRKAFYIIIGIAAIYMVYIFSHVH
jgi:uncharacterized membrane protein YuzA (DUF378 family)